MKHTMDWVEKNCNAFVTYDDNFQIWKRKGKEEYWAYDEDEELFVQVKLIARETIYVYEEEFEIMDRYESDWCGEVDYGCGWDTYDYAWFKRMEEC